MSAPIEDSDLVVQGYEDGLCDIADALSGWCYQGFVINAAGPAARAEERNQKRGSHMSQTEPGNYTITPYWQPTSTKIQSLIDAGYDPANITIIPQAPPLDARTPLEQTLDDLTHATAELAGAFRAWHHAWTRPTT
jgi:hypothetical protein